MVFKLWPIIFMAFIISCKEQSISEFSLANDENTITFIQSTVKEVSGDSSSDIIEISIKKNDELLEIITPRDDKWSVSLTFDETMPAGEISFTAFDIEGNIVSVLKRNLKVLALSDDSFDRNTFNFPMPSILDELKNLWATEYHLPQVNHINNGFPLRDLNGKSLGVELSHKHWCAAALEGSISVSKNGETVTYNYAGTSDGHYVDCSPFYSLNQGRTKFRKAKGIYGDGVRNYLLNPYRTIAVDKDQLTFPYGSVVYIPSARGNKITLPNGSIVEHDGYFFAADTGGAIKDDHIDVFIGVSKTNPFKWIKHNSSGKFKAYRIHNTDIIEKLKSIHIP